MRWIKNNYESMIGEIHGGYTIVWLWKKVWYHQRLMCKCNKCWRIIETRAYHVIKWIPKSCGCTNMVHKDIIGKRYGHLTIIKEVEKKNGRRMVQAKCDCWKITVCNLTNLANWHPVSCWCYFQEKMKTFRKYDQPTRKMRLYTIRLDIQGRVKWHAGKKNYYDRWIKCFRRNFEEFKHDMGEAYEKHVKEFGEKQTTIDRIDVNGHYCKENCRRATIKEQQNNKRVHVITNR